MNSDFTDTEVSKFVIHSDFNLDKSLNFHANSLFKSVLNSDNANFLVM